ncbi:MAG TPA: carbohydrate kinase family protein [Terriglobales bacterium]|nr:carbohydrate kinase family protein [Terriglobales bacterium]
MTPDLVCLGNLIVDDVVFDDGSTRMGEPGGAMLYAALGAALWGAGVAIVAPLGDDYPARTLHALEERGVDLEGLRPLGRPGLRTWLLYEPRGRRVLHRLGAASHADASPAAADIEGRFPGARAFHLTPTPLACQSALLEALARRPGALVSVDPHDPVREDNLATWRAALAKADLFFVSDEELQLEGAAGDPCGAIARLAGGRLRAVLLKRGARGGLLVDARSGEARSWAPRGERRVDPTGAGDAFAGGFLAGLLAGEDESAALERGVVSASFAIEDWGAARLLSVGPAAAWRRREDWFGRPAAPDPSSRRTERT